MGAKGTAESVAGGVGFDPRVPCLRGGGQSLDFPEALGIYEIGMR